MPESRIDRTITKSKDNKLLNNAGLRITAQRELILDIIHKGQGHLDADEIFRLAKDRQPRLSLSTVYRTVQKLKDLSLIEELHFDEAHHHYEIKSSSEHHHLFCLGCGKVIEFQYPLVRLVKKNVIEAQGFEITGSEVRVTGYCASCQEDNK